MSLKSYFPDSNIQFTENTATTSIDTFTATANIIANSATHGGINLLVGWACFNPQFRSVFVSNTSRPQICCVLIA